MRENSLDRANLFVFNEGSGYFQGSGRQTRVNHSKSLLIWTAAVFNPNSENEGHCSDLIR
jgi:hypothetical protein